MDKVTDEAFEKALITLGFKKSEDAEAIEKAAKEKEAADLRKAEEDKALAEKADKEKAEAELAETLEKAEKLQIKLGLKKLEEATVIAKPETQKLDISKELVKGFEDKILALATITSRKDEEIAELKKAMDEQHQFLAKLGEKIGVIEKQPLDRKSLSGANFVERFEKGGNGNDAATKTMSLTNLTERKELTDMMWDTFEKGGFKDMELQKGMQCIEMGGFLGTPMEAQKLAVRLKNEFKVNVVK